MEIEIGKIYVLKLSGDRVMVIDEMQEPFTTQNIESCAMGMRTKYLVRRSIGLNTFWIFPYELVEEK